MAKFNSVSQMRKDLGAFSKFCANRVQENKNLSLKRQLKKTHPFFDAWESPQRADKVFLVLLCAEEPRVPSAWYRLCSCLLLDFVMFQLMKW